MINVLFMLLQSVFSELYAMKYLKVLHRCSLFLLLLPLLFYPNPLMINIR